MNRIKALRKELELSQEQLAIANYFDVSIDYLVGRENDIGIVNGG